MHDYVFEQQYESLHDLQPSSNPDLQPSSTPYHIPVTQTRMPHVLPRSIYLYVPVLSLGCVDVLYWPYNDSAEMVVENVLSIPLLIAVPYLIHKNTGWNGKGALILV